MEPTSAPEAVATETTTPEVSQEQIVNDFQEEFVDQDALPEPQAQKVAKEAPKQTVKTENTQKVAPKTAVDPFSSAYVDETGKFSPDKWMEHQGTYKPKPIPKVMPRIVPPVPGAQQADTTPAWKKELEERRQHETEMKSSLYMYEKFFENALSQGYDVQQAKQVARQQIDERLRGYLEEREYENRAKQMEQRDKALLEQQETARLTPIAEANRATVAQEYGGLEKLDALVSDKELGGEYLLWLFDMQNPDAKYSSQEEYRDSLGKWWIKFAQNPHNIRRVANVGLNALRSRDLPKIIDHVRQKASGTSGKQQMTARTRTVSQPTPSGKPDALNQFMGEERFVDQG